MTKQPSRSDSKPASKTAADGKAGESEVTGPAAMDRFRKLAKRVTRITRDELAQEVAKENRAKRKS